ncbi:unnamed protein product [Symbiodinium sp. CCMP2456]|nr:unnamed protein product [Symbiodinium sp. CCMP2456]
MASPWHTSGLRRDATYMRNMEEMYTSTTAIGKCRLDTVGHLKPCDNRHAPIRLYRSYGEWFEAGLQAPVPNVTMMTTSSRFWPYGQDVTKLHATADKREQYQLDDRTVTSIRPYVPARDGSLPDLRAYRAGGSHAAHIPNHQSFRSFRATGKKDTFCAAGSLQGDVGRVVAMNNFAADHVSWQQHLNREKLARKKVTLAYYGRKGGAEILAPKVPPAPTVEDVSKVMFDRLYRAGSLPALSGAKALTPDDGNLRSSRPCSRSRYPKTPLQSSGNMLLPPGAGPPSRSSSSHGRRTGARLGSSGGRSQRSQEEGLLFFNDQHREKTPSLRSSYSQLSTSSSLWLEVEKAVQEEVAKVVKPLQQQLHTEEEARKRAEEALRILGGTPESEPQA